MAGARLRVNEPLWIEVPERRPELDEDRGDWIAAVRAITAYPLDYL